MEEEAKDKKKSDDLIIAEEKSAGNVGFTTYGKFFGLSCGWIVNIFILLFSVTPAIIQGFLRYFIADWVALSYEEQQKP